MSPAALRGPRTASGRWALAALGAILVVAAILALFPYDDGDEEAPAALEASRTEEIRAPGLAGARFLADRRLVTAETPLVVLEGGEARLFENGGLETLGPVSLPRGGEDEDLGVVRFGDSARGVGRVARSRGGIRVSFAGLESGRRLFDRRLALPDVVERDFALTIGPYDGAEADVAILETAPPEPTPEDRATGRPPLGLLHVLDGERGFRGGATTIQLPLPGLSAAEWTPILARVEGVAGDLVLVRRAGVDLPEIHVLSGESGFQRFIFQTRIILSKDIAARAEFVPALEGGRPVLRAVDRARDRALVHVFRLGPG